jgi:hypothetical protein
VSSRRAGDHEVRDEHADGQTSEHDDQRFGQGIYPNLSPERGALRERHEEPGGECHRPYDGQEGRDDPDKLEGAQGQKQEQVGQVTPDGGLPGPRPRAVEQRPLRRPAVGRAHRVTQGTRDAAPFGLRATYR